MRSNATPSGNPSPTPYTGYRSSIHWGVAGGGGAMATAGGAVHDQGKPLGTPSSRRLPVPEVVTVSRSTQSRRRRLSVDWPIISTHAAQRWHQRRSQPADGQLVGPRVAWTEARRLPAGHELFDCDSARYHESTETVFIRKRTTIVTVLDAERGETNQIVGRLNLRGDES